MTRFAIFVDGSNLFGSLKSMGLQVDDDEALYGHLFDEVGAAWARLTRQPSHPAAQLRRVYWYAVGSIDDWNLSLPQSQTALRNAFSTDRDVHDRWMAVAGRAHPG